jgi:hypothetical protein
VQRLLYVDQGNTLMRSGNYSGNIRPTYESRMDGNYFLPNLLSGDHSTKFGLRWRSTPYETISRTGGGATARIRASGQNEADITRDGDTNREMWQYSLYFSDAIKWNRATVTWGLRFDHQDDRAITSNIAANPILPDCCPLSTSRAPMATPRITISAPRLALAYDLKGNGRTVLKAAGALLRPRHLHAGTVNPAGQTTLSYFWNDLNNDLFVQRNELDFARGFRATPSANYDPANPSSVTTPNRIDGNLENDITDEFVASVDHELMRDSRCRRQLHLAQLPQLPELLSQRDAGHLFAGDVHGAVRQQPLRCTELHGDLLSTRDRRPDRHRAAQRSGVAQLQRHRADRAQALHPQLADEQQLYVEQHAAALRECGRLLDHR